MCASNSISHKRAGYLVASLCFSPAHEFRFMLVNQIQRDLASSNQLEACAALHSVCKIVTEDMVPAVIGEVVKLFEHEQELVRKKAVLAMHRFYQVPSVYHLPCTVSLPWRCSRCSEPLSKPSFTDRVLTPI